VTVIAAKRSPEVLARHRQSSALRQRTRRTTDAGRRTCAGNLPPRTVRALSRILPSIPSSSPRGRAADVLSSAKAAQPAENASYLVRGGSQFACASAAGSNQPTCSPKILNTASIFLSVSISVFKTKNEIGKNKYQYSEPK